MRATSIEESPAKLDIGSASRPLEAVPKGDAYMLAAGNVGKKGNSTGSNLMEPSLRGVYLNTGGMTMSREAYSQAKKTIWWKSPSRRRTSCFVGGGVVGLWSERSGCSRA